MTRAMKYSAVFALAVAAAVPAIPSFADTDTTMPQADAATSAAAPQSPAATEQNAPGDALEATPAPGSAARQSVLGRVLVVPFVTLNATDKQLWIGRAVQEDLLADFGRTRLFSPVAFQGQTEVEDNATAVALAHKANADFVIRGAAQFVNQNLRVTAELIDARSADTVASATVTGKPNDLLKLEDQLAAQLRTGAATAVAAMRNAGQLPFPGQPYGQQPYGSAMSPYAPVPYGPQMGEQTVAPYTPGYSDYYGYPADYFDTGYPYYNYTYGPSYPYAGYPSLGYPYYGVPIIAFGGFGFGFGNRFCFPRDFRHHVGNRGGGMRGGHHHGGWNGGGWNHGDGGGGHGWDRGGGWHGGGNGWTGNHGGVSVSTTFHGGASIGPGIRSVGFHSALSPVGVINGGFHGGGFRGAPGISGFGGFRGGGMMGGFGGGFHGGFGGGGHR